MGTKVQTPPQSSKATTTVDQGVAMFQQGIETGKQWAEQAAQGISVWAQNNPEQVVLVGLAAGFVLGKIFFGGRRSGAR